jgi:D-amino-acid oxidase
VAAVTDVVVVGAGVIGLTAAIRLQAAGASVEVWSADDPLDTVSAVAAAVWYPTRMAEDPRVRAWGLRSYEEFGRQCAGGVPGLLLRDTRNLGYAGETLPWWAPPGASVADGEVRFRAPLAEMGVYLPWLAGQVNLVRRRVDTLRDALEAAPVVVNATGLAARDLAADPTVRPARGQIVLVTNPGLTTSIRGAGFYVHPRRRDVVLGGTFDTDDWRTEPDPATREAILAATRALAPALTHAEFRADRVGLRPVRDGGPRVEADGPVIHAYGHGGAGMTLSWGCADEIVGLWAARASRPITA